MPNIDLIHKKDITPFRRLAIGTWQTAYDPSVYGKMQIKMDRATAYMEAFRRTTGVRLTVSHLVARAAAEALKRMPEANAILRFNRLYLRKRIGIFFKSSCEMNRPAGSTFPGRPFSTCRTNPSLKSLQRWRER